MSVAGSMTLGAARVTGSTLVWRPAAAGVEGERVVDLARVTGHQRNKPGSKRASLRLVLAPGPAPGAKPDAFVMQFPNEPDRDALSDAIKAATATGGPSSNTSITKNEKNTLPKTSAAELAARDALLASNPELAAAHGRLVRGSRFAKDDESSLAAVDEDEFWSARVDLFTDAVLKKGATQKTGISNVLDADIKGARSGAGSSQRGGDVVTATLSNEKMHRIFAERPAVRAAFLENVPKNMTEREFWTRFLRSEYFKAARAGAPPQGEQEAADLALFARRPETEKQRAATAKRVSADVNLAADSCDFGVFGSASSVVTELGAVEGEGGRGGHGIFRDGAKEPPPPSSAVAVAAAKEGGGGGAAAAAKHAAMETLRSLNHHASVVLRGRPDAPVTDARSAALAAEAQEANETLTARVDASSGFGKNASNDVSTNGRTQLVGTESFVALEDLLTKTAAPAKTLRIDDPSRYFASVAETETETTEEASDAKAKRRKTEHFEFGEAVSNAAAAMRFASDLTDKKENEKTSSPAVDGAVARRVLDEISSASRRSAAASKSGASWGGSLSNGTLSALDASSDSDRAALGSIGSASSRDAATAAELLRHFWSAAPLTSVARWEKASRVVSALGTLYDRMDSRKQALPNGARHVFAQRCRPLVSAMDGAFSFFDDEKRARRSAYAAYEKRSAAATKDSETETEKKSVGGPEAPVEVS